jgi:hypothetical protein
MHHAIRTSLLSASLLLALSSIAQAAPMAGITATEVVFFDSINPQNIVIRRPINGLAAGEILLGIDTRPVNGGLYGVTSQGRVAVIDPFTGNVSLIGAGSLLTGTAFGIDFNPVPDRIRLVSNDNSNLRLNPDTGAIAGTDTPLSPAGSKVGAAYDRNFAGTTITTLFLIDSTTDTLARQGGVDGTPSPNGGLITDIGPLGVDTSNVVGFDISSGGAAVASLNTTGGTTGLYNINLATGAATLISNFPANTQVTDVTFIGALPTPLVPVSTLSNWGIAGLIGAFALLAVFGLRRYSN